MACAVITRSSGPVRDAKSMQRGRQVAVGRVNGLKSPIYSDEPLSVGVIVRVVLINEYFEAQL